MIQHMEMIITKELFRGQFLSELLPLNVVFGTSVTNGLIVGTFGVQIKKLSPHIYLYIIHEHSCY